MRRVKDRAAADAGLLVSPGEIIARAAATVPDRPPGETEDEAKVRVWTPPRTADDTIVIPPAAAPMRRARRRPEDTLRYAWFYASRGAVAALLLGIAVGLPAWLFTSGTIGDAEREAAETYRHIRAGDLGVSIAVQRITVEGRNRTPRAAVRAALKVKKGDNLLAADPWAIKQRLEALPWIRAATVARRYPSAMLVTLVERVPIARFRDKAGTVLVDETGALIKVAPEKEHENLVLLAGEGAPEAAAALLKLLEDEPALARRVVAATRLGDRRWDLGFDGGATLRLPDGYAKAALAKFAAFEREHALLARGAVTYDMRLPDRLVIRGTRTATPASAPAAPAKPAAKPARKTG